jgi:two-component system, NarL family, response regulator YdfI
MIDVLVEASSPELRAEIADLLREYSQLRVIETSGTTAERDEGQPQPGVVIVATGPGQDSLESFDTKSGDLNVGAWTAAGVPVILLVDNPALRISTALPPGIRAVLPRNVTPVEIVGAIEAVAAGLYVVHPSEVDSISILRPREGDAPRDLGEPLLEPLTPREVEVLQLLSEGLGNKEIASRLNISEHTAKFHVASIMAKLGAASRTEAVTLGIRRGLVMI